MPATWRSALTWFVAGLLIFVLLVIGDLVTGGWCRWSPL